MEKLKFALFSIVTLALVGFVLYWAINTIQSGTESKTSQKIEQLQKENEDLKTEIKKLNSELGALQSTLEIPAPIVEETPAPIVYKHQSLIDELQKLVNDKVSLKEKSIGAKVGTVQKFLNIYNNTSSRVDNDYGAGMAKLVVTFQKDSELQADGEAGPTTFSKMIDWLKEQE